MFGGELFVARFELGADGPLRLASPNCLINYHMYCKFKCKFGSVRALFNANCPRRHIVCTCKYQ